MKISVSGEGGECFSYDTARVSPCLSPAENDRRSIVAALEEAIDFLMPSYLKPDTDISISYRKLG